MAAVAVGGLALTACSSGSGGGTASGSGSAAAGGSSSLEVFSYWTSGSEESALNSLFSDYQQQYPGITITNSAIAGGGGANATQVLQSRIAGGTPPDTWQTMPGEVLKTFTDQSLALDLTDVATSSGITKEMPAKLVDLMSADGKVYTMPVGIHRQNTLYYNKKVLEAAGVTVPESGLTFAELQQALEAVQATGVTPWCNGDVNIFASAGILEVAILGHVGAADAASLNAASGWDTDAVKAGIQDYLTILGYENSDHTALTWDQGVKLLADGKCGFNMMADSAYGELLKNGAVDGTDFSYVNYPGTDGMYVLLADSFVVNAKIKDSANALNWVKLLGDPDVEVQFAKIKGSIPARSDADVSSLGAYQQWAADHYKTDTIVPTMTYGMAIPPQVEQALYDATTSLDQTHDVDAFISAMENAFS